jgi:cobalamin biosynthesis Mg chelatase CobN
MKSSATQMVLLRTGQNTYSVYFLDGDTGNIETDLPSLSIKFSLDGVSSSEQYFQTVNGVATAQYEYAAVRNNVWASFGSESVYVAVNDAIRSITSGKDSTGDSCSNWGGYWGGPGSGSEGDGSGSGSGNNPGSATSSGSSGSSSGHGSSSGLTSTAGASVASSSSGSTGSSTQGGSTGEGNSKSDSKTAQELFVNDMKGPQVWGIVGVIVLVILIVGAYYRKDIMNIIQKTRK